VSRFGSARGHEVVPASAPPAHTPFMHVAPAGQATPQAPQFAASFVVSTHAPPQTLWLALHTGTHWPAWHELPAAHA
jgi:hypothetical protein